ncbi:MAG: vanadium-dependent haloperoxidase [Deltaproteobacteria bacterium]|nr:vanadium-dependent haloperoxidase [Nannocystaceae bacterium]
MPASRWGSVVVAVALLGCPHADQPRATDVPTQPQVLARVEHRAPNAHATAAYRWVDIMLEVTGREVDAVGARPTIISRQMVIPMTAMYDAWAAYDARAVGTRLGGTLRRPVAEHTLANKEIAIAHAMYLTLVDLFPDDAEWLAAQMRAMGQDPSDTRDDLATPQGIGRAAARAVLEFRRHDGANQHGDMPGGKSEPYADYTGYVAKNSVDELVDPDSWQPIPFVDAKRGTHAPGFLTPHWGHVKPFALDRSDQFRPPAPPKVASSELAQQTDQLMEFNATLTLEHKALVEFMRDGPRSTGQSGHWLQFAQDVSRRDRHDIDRDVKLFFAIANVAFDAFIACWEAKRFYDSSRPWTLVRHFYVGKDVQGYLGECRGVGKLPASAWSPYSPPSFLTPPFPAYPSGHSTVSGASAKILELLTGSDRFGAFARHDAGMYTEQDCATAQMQAKDGVAATEVPPTHEVTIELPSFTATADMAGRSRVMGGYHIEADNTHGLALGRRIALHSWPRYQAYFDGTATRAD